LGDTERIAEDTADYGCNPNPSSSASPQGQRSAPSRATIEEHKTMKNIILCAKCGDEFESTWDATYCPFCEEDLEKHNPQFDSI
jgi:hypothetical protein